MTPPTVTPDSDTLDGTAIVPALFAKRPLRCVACGRFVDIFTRCCTDEPDSHFGPELVEFICEPCDRKQPESM